ncbi:MAG: hypothetical protein GXY38_05320 [Planctomycetes bacterium]|nr:hypothetical protein [Planctomycetota bacterium]
MTFGMSPSNSRCVTVSTRTFPHNQIPQKEHKPNTSPDSKCRLANMIVILPQPRLSRSYLR